MPPSASVHPTVAPSPLPRTALPPALRGMLWGGIAVTIWGVYLAFARANIMTGLMPADIAFVRYAVAGAIMLPWLLRHSPASMSGIGWPRAAMLTLFAGPPFILIGAAGFMHAPLAHGAVIQPAAITIGSLWLGALLLGDRVTRQRIFGAGVILIGLMLIAGPQALRGGVMALAGDALFATAGLMWASFALLSRRWGVSPVAATAAVSVLSASVLVPIYLATHGLSALLAQPLPTLLAVALIHGVLSGVVAVFAFGRAVELIGAPRAATFPALVPVIAIVAGIPIAGEFPSGLQMAGLAIVTLGLLVTQISITLKSGRG